MSDHWNSLANQLGTPSLSPQSKKTTDGASAKAKEISTTQDTMASTDAGKPIAKEPSKLRSGWDAVTSFFGIQTSSNVEPKTENAEETVKPAARSIAPQAKESRVEPKQSGSGRGNRRGSKPSAWTDDADTATDETDLKSKPSAAPMKEDAFAAPESEPVVSFGGRRRERSERKEGGRPAREQVAEKAELPRQSVSSVASSSHLDSDDADGPVERRSQRRAPRRGRSDDLDDGSVAAQPTRSSTDRRESPSNRRSRVAEPVVEESSDESVVRTEESHTNERPSRSGRDRQGRDRGDRNRPTRERPARAERVERDNVDRDQPEREPIAKDTNERDSGRRPRDRRARNDESRIEPDRRRSEPVKRAPAAEAGFGAGLQDQDDDLDFIETAETDDESTVEESTARSADGARRGRNPRRGRRSSGRSSSSADDAERMEADESEKKFIKVPSWIEALDGILQSNMDNHQRNNHGRDRNRGRGPRNNDR